MNELRKKVVNDVWELFVEGYKHTINRAKFEEKLNFFLDDELLDWEACGKRQKRLYDELEEKFLNCQAEYLKILGHCKTLENGLGQQIEMYENVREKYLKLLPQARVSGQFCECEIKGRTFDKDGKRLCEECEKESRNHSQNLR